MTGFNPMTVYWAGTTGVVYRAKDGYTVAAEQWGNAGAQFPARTASKRSQATLLPLSALEKYFNDSHFPLSDVQSQFRDSIVKAVLSHEKAVLTAQQKHPPAVLRNCFEVVQFRFLLDDRLRTWLLSARPVRWSSRGQTERAMVRRLLCDALNIVGVLVEKPPSRHSTVDDFIGAFEDEASRHEQNQPSVWERVFPLVSSQAQYRSHLKTAGDRTKALCKWVQGRRG